jgi:hypothetical protein
MAGQKRGKSFAAKTLAAVETLVMEKRTTANPQPEVDVVDIAEVVFVQTRLDQRRMKDALRYYTRKGRIIKLRPGVYTLPANTKQQTSKQVVMWRLLRARRKVSVNDLIELAGVSRDYAKEWLRGLARRNIVKKVGGEYRLINDPGPEMPVNEEKAAKLRKLRRRKKQAALAALDKAKKANEEARKAVLAMDE